MLLKMFFLKHIKNKYVFCVLLILFFCGLTFYFSLKFFNKRIEKLEQKLLHSSQELLVLKKEISIKNENINSEKKEKEDLIEKLSKCQSNNIVIKKIKNKKGDAVLEIKQQNSRTDTIQIDTIDKAPKKGFYQKIIGLFKKRK